MFMLIPCLSIHFLFPWTESEFNLKNVMLGSAGVPSGGLANSRVRSLWIGRQAGGAAQWFFAEKVVWQVVNTVTQEYFGYFFPFSYTYIYFLLNFLLRGTRALPLPPPAVRCLCFRFVGHYHNIGGPPFPPRLCGSGSRYLLSYLARNLFKKRKEIPNSHYYFVESDFLYFPQFILEVKCFIVSEVWCLEHYSTSFYFKFFKVLNSM